MDANPAGYVIDGTIRHMYLVVKDKENAWACVKNVEPWLRIYAGVDGKLEFQSGDPGQPGASYLHTKMKVTGGGDTDVRQTFTSMMFTVKQVDDTNMKMNLDVLYGGDRDACGTVRNGLKEMMAEVLPAARPDGGYTVKITETGHPNGADFKSCIPVIFFLCEALSACLMKRITTERYTQLQHHFTSYVGTSNV